MSTLTKTYCTVEDIYTKYFTNVKLYFLKYTHDEMKAEDMAHDLFLKLLRSHEVILPQTALALLFTIASRMVASDARHVAFLRRATESYSPDSYYDPDGQVNCSEIEALEQACIATMPPRMRAVYVGSRFEGKRAEELAVEFNIKKRTIESHLFVARHEVREYVRKAMAI